MLRSVQEAAGANVQYRRTEPNLQIERLALGLRRKRMLVFLRRIRHLVVSRFLPTDTASLDRGGRRAGRRRRKCSDFQLFTEMNEDLLLRGDHGGELLNV